MDTVMANVHWSRLHSSLGATGVAVRISSSIHPSPSKPVPSHATPLASVTPSLYTVQPAGYLTLLFLIASSFFSAQKLNPASNSNSYKDPADNLLLLLSAQLFIFYPIYLFNPLLKTPSLAHPHSPTSFPTLPSVSYDFVGTLFDLFHNTPSQCGKLYHRRNSLSSPLLTTIELVTLTIDSGIFGYVNYLVERDRKFIIETLLNGKLSSTDAYLSVR